MSTDYETISPVNEAQLRYSAYSYVRQMIFNTTGSRSNFQIGRTWEPNRPLVDNESWQVSFFVARKRYIPHRVRGKAINIVGIVGEVEVKIEER